MRFTFVTNNSFNTRLETKERNAYTHAHIQRCDIDVCMKSTQPHSIICDRLYYLLLARIPEIISAVDKISHSRPTRRGFTTVLKIHQTMAFHFVINFCCLILCVIYLRVECARAYKLVVPFVVCAVNRVKRK